MGVISVGASLGVREVRATSTAPAPSRKKPPRKRPAVAAKKRANNPAKGEKPARRSPSPAERDVVVTQVVAAKRTGKPVTRLVHVQTTMAPQLLAPHVIGANGGKLNAVMAQARCSISYRKDKEDDASAMSFVVSASTAKRVDDGVQLLQAVVESTEQQLRKQETEQDVEEQGAVEPTRQPESAQLQPEVAAQCTEEPEQSNSAAQEEQRRHKRRREEEIAVEDSSKRGRSEEARHSGEQQHSAHASGRDSAKHREKEKARATDAATRAEEEQRLRDEREAFRIRLARTATIARRLAAETSQARAREVLERDKYLKLRREVEEMAHRKKVAEFVVKQQCHAMTSALSASSAKKKRRLQEVEQLSFAHDASHPTATHVLAPKLRMQTESLKRGRVSTLRSPSVQLTSNLSGQDDDLMGLVKKLQAFGRMIASGSAEEQSAESPHVENDDSEAFEFPSEDATESGCAESIEAAGEVAMDATTEEQADEDAEEKQNPRSESFRSWDLPGLSRDLNLIQDYSSETDCKLLRFLAGERQYFYLEPLSPSSFSSARDVKRWLLTPHDLQILHRYALSHGDLGKDLVLCAERLRALGNLVPPLSSTAEGSETTLIAELGVFESSRNKEWSELQDKMVTVHSLGLVAHMLGKHYLARQVLGSQRDVTFAGATHEDLLTEDTLQSDLFTYILRPIRSSAIESGLFDSLPISLVRETIEQCPEVVNHVLQWKDEDDVPVYLREVDPSDIPAHGTARGARSHVEPDQPSPPSSSYFLRNLLLRLTSHLRHLDVVLKGLVATLTERRPATAADHADLAGMRRQRIIEHINQFKSVTTAVVVENTKLQLHKWWVLFADNACAWFDPDDLDEMDDRSYDKFTCLQDALYVWHNEALLYSTKDDFVVPNEDEDGSPEDLAEPEMATNGYNTRARTSAANGDHSDSRRQHAPMRREEEIAALLRLTPASLRDELQGRPFTAEEAKKCILTPLKVDKVRTQLEESLRVMARITREFGHAGPWRGQVKQSNALKRELAKQNAMQKKLVTHQWARYYTKYQEFAPARSAPASPMEVDEDASVPETQERQPQGQTTSESGGTSSSLPIDWTGVFDPVNDPPEVVEMKKLRHEITLAKDQLLRDMGVNHESALSPDQVALMEECNGLASSCMQALGKFLGDDEIAVAQKTSRQSRSTARGARAEKRVAKSDKTAKTTRNSPAKRKVAQAKSSPGVKARRSEALRVAKALAAPNLGLVLRKSKASARNKKRSGDDTSPLRMGCSGCRDLRRRCTGCSGCCLHCVCVSCGCRMCCSSRLSAVQKSMASMLDLIEAKESCKWGVESSSDMHERACGMLRVCEQCQSCNQHCSCAQELPRTSPTDPHATRETTHRTGNVAGGFSGNEGEPATAPRRGRRFPINLMAALHRGANLPTAGIFDAEAAGSDAQSRPPFQQHVRYSTRGRLPTFNYAIGSEGSFPFGPGAYDFREQSRTWRPAPSDRNEQEDLFRAARVRMKLHRSTFAKSTGLGSSGCLDGEQLWQPERIRMMWERRDFHGVLGLPRDATVQQIKRQYRKLALKLHPDKASDTSASLESTVAETGKRVGAGKRVDAFVAATHSYKILLGDEDATTGLA